MTNQPKPVTKFYLGAYVFGVNEAGKIREPILGLYLGDGTLSRYCMWFSDFKVHAIDWSIMNKKDLKYTVFSNVGGDAKLTIYQMQNPITIEQFVPKNNRTQIGIAQTRKNSFLVRFIISYNDDKDRHMFMVEYPGVPPSDLFGKVYWGNLVVAGDFPGAVSPLFPKN